MRFITKQISLALAASFAICGAAHAQGAMDGAVDPNNPAYASTGATGQTDGYQTETTKFGADQMAAPYNQIAPQGQSYTTGTQGVGSANNPNLEFAEQGLMAIGTGYNRAACYKWGSGGFNGSSKAGDYGGSKLPACATSTCDIHTAE